MRKGVCSLPDADAGVDGVGIACAGTLDDGGGFISREAEAGAPDGH
jgi:hypothetical protein